MGVTTAECTALADIVDLQNCIDRQAALWSAFAEASRPALNTWVIASLTEPKPSTRPKHASISAAPAAAAGTTMSSAPQAAAPQAAAPQAAASQAAAEAASGPQDAPAESRAEPQTTAETDRVAPGKRRIGPRSYADLLLMQVGQVSNHSLQEVVLAGCSQASVQGLHTFEYLE